MTKQVKNVLAMVLMFSTVAMQAQSASPADSNSKHSKAAQKSDPSVAQDLREMRELLENQQKQIDELKRQVADRDAKLATAASDAQAANSAAATASSQAQNVNSGLQQNNEAVAALNATVTDLKNTNAGLVETINNAKKDVAAAMESPAALRYKGIKVTPIGFFAFETVYRSHSINSDVNTPFNSTPFDNAAQAHVSELNFSGRQSRVGALFEGDTGPFKLSGYVEADFLSSGVTSNNNQSNSYTLRQRQIWGQAAVKNGFTVTGGQMWSLVTETKKSTDNRTENLPMTVDAQYQVGFSWARQAAIRFQKRYGNGFSLAASLEGAQSIYGATNAPANFFIGNAGTPGGLMNSTANYTNAVAPDIIVKGTYDAKYGHFELGGLARWFRARYYPDGTGASGTNDTKSGGGFFANLRMPATKYLDAGVHILAGTGVGRYGTSTLPDITVHPDGTLAPIKSYQWLLSLEAHPAKKLDIFGYAGSEYAQRTVYVDPVRVDNAGNPLLVGYAPNTIDNSKCSSANEVLPGTTTNPFAGSAPYNPAGSCGAATKALVEGTAGFTYRVYNSPKYGKLQYQLQYSRLVREAWSGANGITPTANNNLIFTSMRYYIP